MGREIKRVPLDFDWPVGERWGGNVFPEKFRHDPCPAGTDCVDGETPTRAWLTKQVIAPMLGIANNVESGAYANSPFAVSMRKDGIPLIDALSNGEFKRTSVHGFAGFNIINTIIDAAGEDSATWGICPSCKGYCSIEKYPGQDAEAKLWEKTPPPVGEGYQLWSTTSEEGHPLSPVFEDSEQLAQWMSKGRVAFSDDKYTYQEALDMIDEGWTPSLTAIT